jgi:hypothetical protein
LTEKDGKKTLMLINKLPKTKVDATVSIPGFVGKAALKQLTKDNSKKGYGSQAVEAKQGMKVLLPAYSITAIAIE